MTSSNVDLVRSIYAGWSRGDWSSGDWADPEIEWSVTPDGPAPSEGKGLAGLAAAWRDFLGAWEDYRVEADEYRELDGERVLVFIRLSGRGKTSGMKIEEMRPMGANLFEIRDGKVRRLVAYFAREHALADLDLPPDTASTR
jgi:ketosteroid isomerase-like protein